MILVHAWPGPNGTTLQRIVLPNGATQVQSQAQGQVVFVSCEEPGDATEPPWLVYTNPQADGSAQPQVVLGAQPPDVAHGTAIP